MQTKVFSICLDMRQSLPFHPFEVTEGDTGNVLHVTLQNDGEPLLLNDCTVVVVFTSSMGFAMQDETSGVTIDQLAGSFTVLLNPNNYGPGIVSVDMQVYSGPEGKVLITSTRFDFRCRRSLIGEEIIRANAAYPPLLVATQETREATAAALAAAARIDTDLGELNVQSDWAETDASSDAFIRNKPLLTPHAIGAAECRHAALHAAGGSDEITLASIGAEPARLQFCKVAVAVDTYVEDSTFDAFPLRAAIVLAGVRQGMTPEIVYAPSDVCEGIHAPVACCYNGGVYLYAAVRPVEEITIPAIICWQGESEG